MDNSFKNLHPLMKAVAVVVSLTGIMCVGGIVYVIATWPR